MTYLTYPGKRSVQDIRASWQVANLELLSGDPNADNKLIAGDNVLILNTLLVEQGMAGKVDLVYIDPPYSTKGVFRQGDERTSTISASRSSSIAYEDTVVGSEYLEALRERFLLIRELLSDRGALFVHIDYKVGHYVKVLLDEVFGIESYRNDIARIKCNPKNFSRRGFGNIKDMVLFYTKSADFVWNEPRQTIKEHEINKLFAKMDASGRRYTTTPLHAPGETANGPTGGAWRGMLPPSGRHWRYDPKVLDELDAQGLIEWSSTGNPRKIIYADNAQRVGKKLQDIWEFKDPQYPEYPTQKNLDLLETIVSACSNPGGLVMDCYCGSGTTLVAAARLERRWIGIDQSPVAIDASIKRMAREEAGLFGFGFAVYKAACPSVRIEDDARLNGDQPANPLLAMDSSNIIG